jgi:S-adenosylmethionine hydrolase
MPPPIITLLTDFGYKDHYVGVMKGVILGISPEATIVDITHTITPYNQREGALTISNAYSYFPKGTIHVAVVDPGVGSERKAILIAAPDYTFVGPDNGIFGLLYDQLQEYSVYELTNPSFFHKPVSATFHGRDIFAPVAAHLAQGVSPSEMGQETNEYQKMIIPVPDIGEMSIKGTILYTDGFGNAVTNISRSHLETIGGQMGLKVKAGKTIIPAISQNYQNVTKGAPLALLGSSELLEISVREGNARKLLELEEGDEVFVSK